MKPHTSAWKKDTSVTKSVTSLSKGDFVQPWTFLTLKNEQLPREKQVVVQFFPADAPQAHVLPADLARQFQSMNVTHGSFVYMQYDL